MPRIYVSLDLEFTGLDPERDEIIEIGMVRFKGNEVLETYSSLVKANKPIPYKIQQLSGISQAEVDRAPLLSALRGKILAFVKNHPVVGHSVDMDLRFLHRQGMLPNNIGIDTFELATILVPGLKRYSLSNLTKQLKIEVAESHRALPDAMASKDLFLALVARAERWDLSLLEELARLAEQSDWPLLRVFRDIIIEQREKQHAAILSGEQREPARLRLMPRETMDIPPLEPTETITPVDADELAAMISPGGPFERLFPGYEHRPQQVEMLRGVCEAMNLPTHLLVEAGTGIGKSLAYILPAAYLATQNGRRVVISSATINLQDQLYTKDIPDIQRILPISFNVALLKGRGNYICMRRLSIFRRSRQLSIDEARVLAKVFAWLPATKTGDRAELLLINKEVQVWSQIQATSETCMGDRCPYRQRGQCLFYRARARAERAHLLIINHALMLSDLALENRILPEYKYLIIDEAHHLEEQATRQFGLEVGRQDVYMFLSSLGHHRSGAPGRETMTSTIEKINSQIGVAQQHLSALFDRLASFLEQHGDEGRGGGGGQQRYARNIRLTSGLRIQPGWYSVPMLQILDGLERLRIAVEGLALSEDSERDEIAQEIKTHLQRGKDVWAGLDRILMEPDENGIYWASIARKTQDITLNSAPLHVGSMLEERLFAEKDCVLLTSATLRTSNSFGFIEERLGLEEPIELALDSPFDFKTSVLLYVPKDIPEPNQPYYQKAVEQALVDLCRATEGRTLVLFTSNSQLYATYYAIHRSLDKEGVVVFGQGIDGSRRQILESFRTTPKSVLFGTRSFWEGIDVVGEALSCLVMTRLPFSVPTDPIFVARAETIENPFENYYLPEAILRFRQGFGRLIRSRDDYGIVVVLDKRLLTKSYGKTILRSLPPCTARQGPLQSLPDVARRWLDPANRP